MKTVFLVPRRPDNGPRDRSWEYCRARWERYFPEVAVVEGHHIEGPFSRSKAINLAARLADEGGRWDFAIVIDADVMLKVSQVRQAMKTAKATGKVTWAHRRWRGITKDWTERIVADQHECGPEIDHDDVDVWVERTTPISWSCCFVVPRAVFDDLGGFDERFVGWGFEDLAWQASVVGLYGHERIEGDVYHFWHPRSEERIIQGQPGSTASRAYVLNARLGRRYMLALRRDHGLHDRPGLPASEQERQQDIANLKRDDAKLAAQNQGMGLPDWSKWWPTLEELREGAKGHLEPHVTLVVMSGGLPSTWQQRRAYLEKAVASLKENVQGPIAKRVIYSTWPDESIRAWLRKAFPDFYIVGPEPHEIVAWPEAERHARSMSALFKYLSRKALTEYVFLAEDDFVYTHKVELRPLVEALDTHPHLVQIALLRQPVHPREIEKGGVLGWPRESFTSEHLNGFHWLEHRNFWTNNPSLFRQSLTSQGWPVQPSSERLFGNTLLRDVNLRFGIWGDGEAWVEHIGEVRSSSAY